MMNMIFCPPGWLAVTGFCPDPRRQGRAFKGPAPRSLQRGYPAHSLGMSLVQLFCSRPVAALVRMGFEVVDSFSQNMNNKTCFMVSRSLVEGQSSFNVLPLCVFDLMCAVKE